MSKQYICTGTWRRNNKGDIISEFEYKKMPIEAKENNYQEYTLPETQNVFSIGSELEVQPFAIDIQPAPQTGTLSELKKSWKSNLDKSEEGE